MKQFDSLKKSLLAASLLLGAATVNAQVHPLAFGSQTIGGTATASNWYANYVGLRFEVVSPASVAGDKLYKMTNDGDPANTTNWGGTVPPLIIDMPVIMPQPGDSLAGGVITVSMTGKVGLVYRGGGIEFGAKARKCQDAGASVCVIINNVGGGPVGMAAGSLGSGVTIPVFMISKADGDALASRYHNNDTPHVTITNWGQGFNNDLGFVPGGLAGWHAYAVPRNQMANVPELRGMDGAFIANYGNNPITGVKVKADLFYTPTGSAQSTTPIHTTNTGTLANFTVVDSIYAMFGAADYVIPTGTGTGRYDLTYTISSDSVDDFAFDNVATTSFYATDSLYSKGRYDFAANEPIRSISYSFNSNGDFIWGPMYYVANSGSALSRLQYSIAMTLTAGAPTILPGEHNIYLFKWVDGYVDADNSFNYPLDSIVQNGELQFISAGVKQFDGVNDTSGALLNFSNMGDTDGVAHQVVLDANSWYFVGIGVPATMFLGSDGVLSPYPRIYGRYMNNGILDNTTILQAGFRADMIAASPYGNSPSQGGATAYVNSVDSFNFDGSKGMIPAVAMIIKPAVPEAVTTSVKPVGKVNLFPNPASDQLTVSLEMEKTAGKVTYEVLDGLAKFVTKTVHTNVQNDKTIIDTKNFAPGNYFLFIHVDGKTMTRKFTVIK